MKITDKMKKSATDRLINAAKNYLDAHGGSMVVASGISVMQFPEDRKNSFHLSIKFIGSKPTAPALGDK